MARRNIINLEHWRERIAIFIGFPGFAGIAIWGASLYFREVPRSPAIWDKIGFIGLILFILAALLFGLTERIERLHNRHQRWLDGH